MVTFAPKEKVEEERGREGYSMPKRDQRITVCITEEVKEQLARIAEKEERTISSLCQILIREGVRRRSGDPEDSDPQARR